MITLRIILFVFYQNFERNPSFLLKEVTIRRKLGRGASLRRYCCYCIGCSIEIRNILIEILSYDQQIEHVHETHRRDHVTLLSSVLKVRLKFNNIVFQAATMPAQHGSSI